MQETAHSLKSMMTFAHSILNFYKSNVKLSFDLTNYMQETTHSLKSMMAL